LVEQINSIGRHTNTKEEGEGGYEIAHSMEVSAISWCAQLVDAHPTDVHGHFCSGGTEANFEGMLIGRRWLENLNNEPITLIVSPTVHYSIHLKSASILKIDNIVITDINNKFQMDLNSLKQIIQNSNTKNIMIVATVSTTGEGAIDNIRGINSIITNYKDRYNFYLHIDAASGSFMIPFVKKTDLTIGKCDFGFDIENVDSITLDGHKMGYLPYPSAMIIYQKKYEIVMDIKVDYIKGHHDGTVVGSRNGAFPIFANYIFQKYGFQWYAEHAKNSVMHRDILVDLLRKRNIKGVHILNYSPYTNFLPLAFDKDLESNPNLKSYHLRVVEYNANIGKMLIGENKTIKVYKICIMPHNYNSIEQFINDIEKAMS